MLYLEFISPSQIRVPINSYAIIRREGLDVVVESESGPYVIGNDLTVSRKTPFREGHAKILVKRDELYIQDLGSKNGTRIDGEIIKGWREEKSSEVVKIRYGQHILLGYSTLFRVVTEPTSDRELPRLNEIATLTVAWAMLAEVLLTLSNNLLEESESKFSAINEGALRRLLEPIDSELCRGLDRIRQCYFVLASGSNPLVIRDLKKELEGAIERVKVLIQVHRLV
jgi:hypothetical protein